MNEKISLTSSGDVAVVVINRPERRNALDLQATVDLGAAIREAAAGGVRALVLRGSDGHFCAGADLTGVEDPEFVTRLNEVLAGLRDMPGVTIAAAEGATLGAGTQLAVACDLRVATAEATFGVPAAKLGLMVDHWTVQRLAAMVGQPTARAMLLAAETVSGQAAAAAGWVQRLGGPEDAIEWAHSIARLAPLTVAGHKLGLNGAEAGPGDVSDYEAARQRAWSSDDLQEGLAAFSERRRPEFRGR